MRLADHIPDFTAPAPEAEIVPLRMDEAAREDAKVNSFVEIRARAEAGEREAAGRFTVTAGRTVLAAGKF